VGIGGIGMSGIAELLLNLDYKVSGSDARASDITRRLARRGGVIYQGHASENIQGADVVVVSSAIDSDNPEVVAANEAGIPVIPRAEMLAELMRLKYSVAVAGAHGKTSTTSIVASVMGEGGLDPTVVIGGILKSIDANALLGEGEFIVAEADESDGSFLKMSPTIAVVTNIDREHLDFYEDMEDIKAAFLSFVESVPFYGLSVLCLDSEPIQALIPNIKKRITTYGMTTQADYQARNVRFKGLRSHFSLYHLGEDLGDISLSLPGRHNVYNAMASVAVGMELGIVFPVIKKALENLEGVQRRLEVKGAVGDITVVDDYGHHPTEIKTTLEAMRECWPESRIVVVFQPHRYTRTQALFDEFTRGFYQSDVLVVLPIYAASENPISGIDSRKLCEGIRTHGHKEVLYEDGIDAAVNRLKALLKSGDVLLTLGAGDVWKVGESLLAEGFVEN
jgi:UDP-N-acetylmuramate--alanine ligase